MYLETTLTIYSKKTANRVLRLIKNTSNIYSDAIGIRQGYIFKCKPFQLNS